MSAEPLVSSEHSVDSDSATKKKWSLILLSSHIIWVNSINAHEINARELIKREKNVLLSSKYHVKAS